MYVLQLVLFIRVLDFKGFCKSIAKVMARSGLKRLAVVHQRLDGVEVASAPANFSLSVFWPRVTGMARTSSQKVSIEV